MQATEGRYRRIWIRPHERGYYKRTKGGNFMWKTITVHDYWRKIPIPQDKQPLKIDLIERKQRKPSSIKMPSDYKLKIFQLICSITLFLCGWTGFIIVFDMRGFMASLIRITSIFLIYVSSVLTYHCSERLVE